MGCGERGCDERGWKEGVVVRGGERWWKEGVMGEEGVLIGRWSVTHHSLKAQHVRKRWW